MDIGLISRWFETIETPLLPDGVVLETWHSLSHQCRFVKTLPAAASVLDVGAGDGALQIYRKWPAPKRLDLTMYAFAMDRGSMFGQYDAHEVGVWPEVKPTSVAESSMRYSRRTSSSTSTSRPNSSGGPPSICPHGAASSLNGRGWNRSPSRPPPNCMASGPP